jgi:hypothetical protein
VSGSKDNARVQRNNGQVWYTVTFDLLDFTLYLHIAIYQTTIVLEELPELQCGHDSGGGYCSLHPSNQSFPFDCTPFALILSSGLPGCNSL